MKTLSILGAGWLGLEVAKTLSLTYEIKASTTTEQKLTMFESLGFEPILLNENSTNLNAFLTCNVLLIALPPSKCKDYLGFLEKICTQEAFEQIEHILFISSTSVYDKKEQTFHEDSTIVEPRSQMVFDAESYMLQRKNITVLRCAGLMGAGRIAGKYFESQPIKDPKSAVNHVHRYDVVRAIEFVLRRKLWGVYNVCAPSHPTKQELYTHNAKKYEFTLPLFEGNEGLNRIIDSKKLMKEGFEYKYTNPFDFNHLC